MQHLFCGTQGDEYCGTVLDEANVQHPSLNPFLTAAAGPLLHRAMRGGIMKVLTELSGESGAILVRHASTAEPTHFL